MVAQVRMGVRVLVPLGRSKTYTAMAVRLHSEKPEFETRPIIQVIDAEPVPSSSSYTYGSGFLPITCRPLATYSKPRFLPD